jgi:dual specificity tyrosine-phosphorylation-regulated kinase 2/3/4
MLKAKGSCALRVIDLGSACLEPDATRDYVQSRYYRAPEVILGMAPYSRSIDIWSVATILVELLLGRPLFPGENETDQIIHIGEVLGLPPAAFLAKSERGSWYFEKGGFSILGKNGQVPRPGSRPLEEIVGDKNPLFLDFVKKGLAWDPRERMTAEEALAHPWVVG